MDEEKEQKSDFHIGIFWDKYNLIKMIVALAVMLALCLYAKIALWPVLLGATVYFGIKSLKIQLPRKAKLFLTVLVIGVSAWMTETMVQYLLLDAELRVQLSETYTRLNIFCCAVVYLVFLLILANPKRACIAGHVSLMVLAGINYFVYQFRGNEFSIGDLKAASTGLSVASKYQFVLVDRAVYVIILSILYVAFIRKLEFTFRRNWMLRLSSLAAAVVLFVYVAVQTDATVTESWEQKGTYRNGYILNFALGIRDSFIFAPDGYSKEAISSLEAKYPTVSNEGLEEDPTIIVIMNESFADLRKVAHCEFNTTQEVMPFFDSMQDNVIKGYALSSVFGAKTPDSEWEFLTGNSMAFLPSGSVPYQQYMAKEPYSLVSTLKERGYTCKAMHPYYETGWSRNKVYPMMGFDEMLFLDDFDQSTLMREYIPDQVLYDKIVEQFEAKDEDEKLFIMSITMQNHGGYGEYYPNFKNTVSVEGMYYSDVNQYLSLIRESDQALEDLITYFEGVDERVEIVFFGDHQPSLNSYFYEKMNGKGLSGLDLDELQELFTVPFFIWTNYETPTQEVELTSLNYLSTMALERADIELPAYNRFLSDLSKEIPAMNARAFYSVSEGEFLHYDEASGEEAEALNEYNILQYNNMFDSDVSRNFFPYYEGE